MTPEQQANVVMENYDPQFASRVAQIIGSSSPPSDSAVKSGVILVSGFNFGTGSSREQAATALKFAGVPLVIAGSFGDIFKRNSINNGLICIECPELVEEMTQEYAKDGKRGAGGKKGEISVEPGWDITVDMRTGKLQVLTEDGKREYSVRPVGTSVQELWTCGGLEGFVLKTIKSTSS
jgi:homoaconitate hydratase